MNKNNVVCKLCLILTVLVSGCSKVVEPINLPEPAPSASLQQDIKLELYPLTYDISASLNSQVYERLVSRPGKAYSADVISVDTIAKTIVPPNPGKNSYKLGVGDELVLTQYVDSATSINNITGLTSFSESQNTSNPSVIVPNQRSNIIATTGRIGTDGELYLIDVGRLNANGRELPELREQIRNILIRNGKIPNFQLEITEFNSQKILITTDAAKQGTNLVLPITDRGLGLKEVLSSLGIIFNEKLLTIVKLQRNNEVYSFSLSDLYSEQFDDIFLRNKDHIFIQNYEYIDGKVFLVGGVTPRMIPISPERRQTLAEIIFAPSGPMAIPTAQRSAVYLLRGRDPIKAYHLDVRNPSRIMVAEATEMRPNDIVFVAEQPVNTFNRMLATILPLRIFSRDVRDENFP